MLKLLSHPRHDDVPPTPTAVIYPARTVKSAGCHIGSRLNLQDKTGYLIKRINTLE